MGKKEKRMMNKNDMKKLNRNNHEQREKMCDNNAYESKMENSNKTKNSNFKDLF